MREEQGRAMLGVWRDDFLEHGFLRHVRRQERDQVGVFHGIGGFGRIDLVSAGVGPAFAAFADAGDDVVAAVAHVLGMSAALAAVAQDGDASAFQCVGAHVVICVNFHHEASR